MLTQQCLPPSLTIQRSHHCSRMYIPVHSPWLPGYINVAQTILVIFTMIGLFLDRPYIHTYTYNHIINFYSLPIVRPGLCKYCNSSEGHLVPHLRSFYSIQIGRQLSAIMCGIKDQGGIFKKIFSSV